MLEDRNVRGAAADVNQQHAQLPLVGGQRGFRRGQGLEHQAVDRHAAGLHRIDRVLQDCGVADGYVGLQLHLAGVKADGIAHSGQTVHRITDRNNME